MSDTVGAAGCACVASVAGVAEQVLQSRTASTPPAPGAGAAAGEAGLVSSPAPEPSFALAGQELLENYVAGLIQYFIQGWSFLNLKRLPA